MTPKLWYAFAEIAAILWQSSASLRILKIIKLRSFLQRDQAKLSFGKSKEASDSAHDRVTGPDAHSMLCWDIQPELNLDRAENWYKHSGRGF